MTGRVQQLRECLEAIASFEPHELAYDQYAYWRMVESYRAAARNGLVKDSESEPGA